MKNYLVRLSLLLCVALLFSASTDLFAQSSTRYSAEVENKIKQVEDRLAGPILVEGQPGYTLAGRMAYYKVHGLSIAVVHDYKIEWAKGYGWADSSEKRPVTTQTLFQAASISKSLHAVGVLKLVQDHKLDPYADINDYLTTWKFPYDSVSKNKKISVAHLLSHTAGLNVHGFPGYEMGQSLPTVPQILDGKKPANTSAVRSMFEPGLRSEYSGGGTTISQLIVMDITHQAYDQYMWEQVLKPMDMTGSSYTQPAPPDKRLLLATGYRANGAEIKGKYHVYPEDAPAGLWTNPTDLCKYIIETQLSYEGRSAKVLSQQTTRLRLTPYMNPAAALGVFIDTKGETKYFQHGGANEGFRCQYYGSLQGGDGLVIMVNSDDGRIIQEIMNSIAIVYNWKGFYTPEHKKIASLSSLQLKAFEGKYQLQGGKTAYIQISATDDHIVLKQLWDGKQIDLFPESDLEFFNKDTPFPLKFTKAQDGAITAATVFNRDVWNKVE